MKRNVGYRFSAKLSFRNLFLVTAIVLFSGLNASAQQSSRSVNFKNGSITYNGSVDQKLVFTLSVENSTDDKIAVTILNEQGERIFRGTFHGKKIDKFFKLPDDNETLTFIISNPADKSVQQFKINTERRYVADVTVTKTM